MGLPAKKILMLNYEFPPLGGGGGIAAKKLAKGFIEHGYQIDYVTTRYNNFKQFEIIDGINVYRIKVIARTNLSTATISSLISFPFFAYAKCLQLVKENNYDFINTHFAVPTGPLGVLLSRRFGLINVLSLHGGDIYDPSKKNSPHIKWYYKKVVKWVLDNSDHIVAQSANTMSNAINFYNPKKKIAIVPLPYEPYRFKHISRSGLGLQQNCIYIISIGRLVKRKGFDFLIKCIATLQNKNIHALIIGQGREKENLEHLAKTLNISDQVHFLGFVTEEQKFQYLSNSDVYFLSSVHEGFGIVLQEAMQVGLPIIATNNGGQTDLIENGRNGYLINFGNIEQFKKYFWHTIRMGKALKGINEQKIINFEPQKIATKYIALIKK